VTTNGHELEYPNNLTTTIKIIIWNSIEWIGI